MKEREFQKQVLALFRLYHWKTAHFDASVRIVGKERRFVGDTGSSGFPDITATKGGRLIFAELKSETGRVSPEQRQWLDLLSLTEAEVYVWRPADLEEIHRVITRPTS